MKSKKPWYNYWNPPYSSEEPNYYPAERFEWAKKIISLQPKIKEELEALIEKRKGKLFAYYSPAVSTDGEKWHTLAFKTWGINVFENQKECPTIQQLLIKFPQMVSASVNILMPGAELKEHQGDSDSFYRCHLGIEIPCGLPDLGFEVEGEAREWSEENLIIFLDAKSHKAYNYSDKRRVIFLFDFIKDEYVNQQKKICLNVRSFLLLQYISGKYPKFLNWSKKNHRVVFIMIKGLLILIYPYQKRKGVIIKHS